ncbi:hypothetical protein TCON_0952 [Astathelohania contejeani]|uniref:Uncharacterized protein n=1 Tax=Astathelohania contejeani TaxID=164912 RepID=A0ABQ7I098_9MICR|nr:hypothetical protein TCON_0952 [Thelohania contejeani]
MGENIISNLINKTNYASIQKFNELFDKNKDETENIIKKIKPNKEFLFLKIARMNTNNNCEVTSGILRFLEIYVKYDNIEQINKFIKKYNNRKMYKIAIMSLRQKNNSDIETFSILLDILSDDKYYYYLLKEVYQNRRHKFIVEIEKRLASDSTHILYIAISILGIYGFANKIYKNDITDIFCRKILIQQIKRKDCILDISEILIIIQDCISKILNNNTNIESLLKHIFINYKNLKFYKNINKVKEAASSLLKYCGMLWIENKESNYKYIMIRTLKILSHVYFNFTCFNIRHLRKYEFMDLVIYCSNFLALKLICIAFKNFIDPLISFLIHHKRIEEIIVNPGYKYENGEFTKIIFEKFQCKEIYVTEEVMRFVNTIDEYHLLEFIRYFNPPITNLSLPYVIKCRLSYNLIRECDYIGRAIIGNSEDFLAFIDKNEEKDILSLYLYHPEIFTRIYQIKKYTLPKLSQSNTIWISKKDINLIKISQLLYKLLNEEEIKKEEIEDYKCCGEDLFLIILEIIYDKYYKNQPLKFNSTSLVSEVLIINEEMMCVPISISRVGLIAHLSELKFSITIPFSNNAIKNLIQYHRSNLFYIESLDVQLETAILSDYLILGFFEGLYKFMKKEIESGRIPDTPILLHPVIMKYYNELIFQNLIKFKHTKILKEYINYFICGLKSSL